jgi:hypothetical protein
MAATETADVYHVTYRAKHTLQEKLLHAVRAAADQVDLWLAGRQREGSLPQ